MGGIGGGREGGREGAYLGFMGNGEEVKDGVGGSS
jgi:hypothetical protein